MTEKYIWTAARADSAIKYLQRRPKTGPAYHCAGKSRFLDWLAWRSNEDTAPEEGKVMKAFLVLAAIYVAAFLIAIQGAAPTSADGTIHKAEVAHIDPAKEADIRSLMEMVGARAVVQDATSKNVEQVRENLVATMPASDRGQQFVDAFVSDYQKKFNADEVTGQLVGIYDKHFTDDEIKGLLQFYGSPLGRKFAAEMPKIASDIQAANQAVSTRVAKSVLQDLPNEYLGINSQESSPREPQAAQAQPVKQLKQPSARTQPESMASASQP
jgi:hypothetical protein